MRTQPCRSFRAVMSSVVLGSFVVVAGCDPATSPAALSAPQSVQLELISGGDQTGPVGLELPAPVQVRITDRNLGLPVPGFVVNWVVTSGAGTTFVGATQTNARGFTQNVWTLGATPGRQTLEVRAISPADGSKLVFATIAATGTIPVIGVVAGHSYHFEQRYDGVPAKAGEPWDARAHVFVLLVDDQTDQVGMLMPFWITNAGGGCTWSDATLTCPSGGQTVHVDFQQGGFDGVDNPAFRPAIDLVVEP